MRQIWRALVSFGLELVALPLTIPVLALAFVVAVFANRTEEGWWNWNKDLEEMRTFFVDLWRNKINWINS